MKARVKSWEEIKKTLEHEPFGGRNYRLSVLYRTVDPVFVEDMKRYCGEIFDTEDRTGTWGISDYHWHRDWLEIIDEDAEIAETYALLLIESGEI